MMSDDDYDLEAAKIQYEKDVEKYGWSHAVPYYQRQRIFTHETTTHRRIENVSDEQKKCCNCGKKLKENEREYCEECLTSDPGDNYCGGY